MSMESNRDEALKCLAIAQRHRDAGNLPSARRFAQKSLALFATPEAEKMITQLESMESSASSSSSQFDAEPGPSARASATEAHPSSDGTRHRTTGSTSSAKANGSASEKAQSAKKRDWTPEQAAVVKRVRACKLTEYYEILNVKRECEEADIKKAYRKVCTAVSSACMRVFGCSYRPRWLCDCVARVVFASRQEWSTRGR